MINEKNNFLTVSWLSGLLSAEIFISTGEWGVQMPPLTSENSYFLRSGPQGATLVMKQELALLISYNEYQWCWGLFDESSHGISSLRIDQIWANTLFAERKGLLALLSARNSHLKHVYLQLMIFICLQALRRAKLTDNCTTARNPANKAKNRYRNVIPCM